MLTAAPSNFCGNGYSCPGEASDVNVAVLVPSTMVFKINGADAPTDGSIEIGFIFYDADTDTYWRAMTYDGGEAVGLFWTGSDDGSSLYGDNSLTDEVDGFLTNSKIYIYVYDKTADKFYTISSYKLRNDAGALVTTFKPSYLFTTLEELYVYTSPVITNPADMAVSQPLSVTLTWDAISGASSYDVQASANSDFSTLLIDANITTTTKTFASLSNNTRYYWKVRATVDGVQTDWSDAEFLTQLTTPSITSPSTGLTNINPKSASIGFSSVSGANSYRLTFHPTSGSDIIVDATSSPKTVTTLNPCVQYTLTVQASNTGTGNTSPVSSSITLTTLPNAPTLTAPANSANNVALAPTFEWTRDGDCSAKYKLTVWEGANTTNTTITSGAVSPSYTWANADLKNFTTYSWTVTPINGSNQEGAVSSTRTFTTLVACASLVSPANGATGVIPATTNLVFNQVAGASKYTVIVKDPSNNVKDTKVVNHISGNTTNSVSMTAANYGYSTTYTWTVTVEDIYANTRVCGPWTFTTPPAAPILKLPVDDASNISLNPSMRLEHIGTDYSTVTNFEVVLTKTDGTAVDSKTITRTAGDLTNFTWNVTLTNYTGYKWKARSKTAGGILSDWSTIFDFTTEVACVTLVSPANDAKGVIPANDDLVFNQVAGGAQYTVDVKVLGGGAVETLTVNQIAGTTNFVSMTPALYAYSTKYEWTVSVKDVFNNTKVCETRTFTTPPAAPILKLPVDDANNISLNPSMRLEHIGGDYSTVTEFEVVLTKTDGTAVDSKTIGRTAGDLTNFTWNVTLTNYTGYKWKARSKTASGVLSDWSTIFDFTTEVACVTLVSPANDAKGVIPANDDLVFNQVAGGAQYTVDVEVFGGGAVETLTVNQIAGTTNFVSMTPALYAYSTKYEWTVSVKDVFNNTKVCESRTFTTPPAAPILKLPVDDANNVSLSPSMRLEHIGADYSTVTEFEVVLTKANGTAVDNKTIGRTAGDLTNFTWNLSLNNFTEYKWKARSKTASGVLSDWSSESSFTTMVSCVSVIDPQDGAHGFKPATSPFKFYQVDGGAKYTIIIKDPANAVVETKFVMHTAGAMTNSIQMTGSYNYATEYTWTMTVEDTYGNTRVCGPMKFDTPPAAPTLVTPANNANGIALNPTFKIDHTGSNYTGVTTFQVIVTNVPDSHEAANFEVTKNSSGNTTSFGLIPASDLKPFKAHTWKARSLNSDGIYSDWSGNFNFTTEVACTSPVKPTNNQKFVLVGTDIEWSPVTGAATYQLLVSKNSDMATPFINVTQAGNSYNPAADFEFRTNYYWTIKITDTYGNTKTCGIFTFETELDAPRLTWPENAAVCIPVQHSTGFQWQTYSGAQKYDLQYSKVNNDWNNATTISNLTTTNKPFSGLERNATYYWRVQAWVDGVSTGYCGAYTFSTIDKPVVLSSPAEGTCGVSTSSNFSWNAISGTTKYTVNVTTDPTFATIDFTEQPSASNVTISGLQKGKDYFWRVTSDKCGSNDLTEAEIRTFRVVPGTPALVSPADDAVDVSSWGDLEITGTTGTDGYNIVISEVSTFATTAFEYFGTDLTPPYNGLNSNTHYYWKARAYQTCSGTKQYGDWTNVFEFDTKLLGPPQIDTPADESKHIFLDVDLKWFEVPNVSYYALQVSTDETFTNAEDQLVNEAKVFDLSWSLTGLDYGTTYFWRLRSVIAEEGVYEESGWSKAYSFTTIPAIAIEGPTDVCVGIENIKDYTLEAISGITYTWTVTGGTIESDGNATDNNVTVKWTTPGTGKLKVVRSGSVWGSFTDAGTLDVTVNAVATIDISLATDTYYDNKFCPNENIEFTATINDANITEGDFQDYYWDFGDGNIISNTLSTTFAWENPGTYTVKFYARTHANGCAEYSKTLSIAVTGDCAVTAILLSDNYICNGAPSALFETYVFGGAGGDLLTDYKYSWVPKASFQNPTEKDGIYLTTTVSKWIDFYAYDKNDKSGHLKFKVYLRSRPVPSVISTMRVPLEIDNIDLENGDAEGNYKLLKSYGCGGSGQSSCDDWSWIWYDETYSPVDDYNDVDINPGINIFYLISTNEQGCASKMVRGVVYRVRSKEIMDYEFTTSRNETAVMFAYPNPAVNYLKVFAEFEKESNLNCSIVDLQGKLVKSFNTVTGKIYDNTIEVTDITAGTYFLMIESNNDAVIWKFNKQ
jgi:hypothetical protein